MTRQPATWGQTYNRLIAKGWDHGSAAWRADLHQKSLARKAKRPAAPLEPLPATPRQGGGGER